MANILGKRVLLPRAFKFNRLFIIAIAGLFISMQFGFLTSRAGATKPTTDNSDKIMICHADNNANQPYGPKAIEVDKNGLNGHDEHTGPLAATVAIAQTLKTNHQDWGDIIPPYDGFPGYNWDAAGEAIWHNDCQIPEEVPNECNLTAVSDTTNTVNEKNNANAVALSYIHPAWTASIPGATWIWGDNPVTDPTNQTTQTFKKTFYWNGPVTNATLTIAADNNYDVYINGNLVQSDATGATFGVPNTYDITSSIQSDALNTLEIKVTNWAWNTTDPQVNPAGLLYKAVIIGPNENCADQPEEPHVPAVTLVAQKVVCDDESLLPNNAVSKPVSVDTAADWIKGHQGCHLADNWSFEYKTQGDQSNPGGSTVGQKGGDWHTFTASGDTASVNVPIDNVSLIQTREVLPAGYIPFTDTSDNVSAEFYCHTDAANYDNWEWIQNLHDGDTYYCVAWNVPVVPTFHVNASKVICNTEADLPNWGAGHDDITASTAQNWVDQSQGACHLADWKFQWSPDNVGNPGDNLGEQNGAWTIFDNGDVELPVNAVGTGNKVWFREVMDDNYIPFTGEGTTKDVSAEFYCNNDVLNYDNWEWIQDPQANAHYDCVGFNVLKPAVLSATKIECDTEQYLPNWGNGQSGPGSINADTADEWLAQGDNSQHCHKIPWQFQWVSDAKDNTNPGDETAAASSPWKSFNDSSDVDVATLGENHKIWVRETFNESYIPFTGQGTAEDVSAEMYCGSDILNYDNWEFIDNLQPGQNYNCVAWNVPIDGQISGLVYRDANNNSVNDAGDTPQENKTVWLLTHNSPWTLKAVESTDTGGNYLFDKLSVPGTYYVCQDVESGWFQTQLNQAGLGGLDVGSAVPGDVIGDSPDLDALIAKFCYEVHLTSAAPTSTHNDFGNYNSDPQVLGESTEKDPATGGQGGEVLGASTELTNTGQSAVLPILFAGAALLITAGSAIVSRRQRRN